MKRSEPTVIIRDNEPTNRQFDAFLRLFLLLLNRGLEKSNADCKNPRAKHREKGDQGCPGKAVRAEYLESIVWDEVKKILQDPGLLRDALNAIQAMRDGVGGSLQSDLERLSASKKDYERLASRFLAKWKEESGDKDVAEAMFKEYKECVSLGKKIDVEIAEVKRKIKASSGVADNIDRMIEDIKTVLSSIETASNEEKILAFDALSVTVKSNGPESIQIEIMTSGQALSSRLQRDSDARTFLQPIANIKNLAKELREIQKNGAAFGPWVAC